MLTEALLILVGMAVLMLFLWVRGVDGDLATQRLRCSQRELEVDKRLRFCMEHLAELQRLEHNREAMVETFNQTLAHLDAACDKGDDTDPPEWLPNGWIFYDPEPKPTDTEGNDAK